MSHLFAVAYPDESRAAEAMVTVQQMGSDDVVDLEDVVVVTRGQDGAVRLHQDSTRHLSAKGAALGALAGVMVGMLAFLPGLGIAIGAGLGALEGRRGDHGIDDDFMKELGEHLKPGSSAIFVLTPYATPKAVRQALRKHGGTSLQTTLSEQQVARLRSVGIDPR